MDIINIGNGIFQYFLWVPKHKEMTPKEVPIQFMNKTNAHVSCIKCARPQEKIHFRNRKTVKFNENPEIHTLYVWQFAYLQARVGKWEQMGRDRVRFHERIMKINEIIEPILIEKLKKMN